MLLCGAACPGQTRGFLSHPSKFRKNHKKRRIEQVISRVLFPSEVTPRRTMIIHLGPRLLEASSDLPESLDGPPSALSYSVLLRVGFTEPPVSPPELVNSYLTVSPLPRDTCHFPRRFTFCGTFLPVTRTGRYPAPCPAELGLSSSPFAKQPKRGSDHLTYSILSEPSGMSLLPPPADHDRLHHWPVDPPAD